LPERVKNELGEFGIETLEDLLDGGFLAMQLRDQGVALRDAQGCRAC